MKKIIIVLGHSNYESSHNRSKKTSNRNRDNSVDTCSLFSSRSRSRSLGKSGRYKSRNSRSGSRKNKRNKHDFSKSRSREDKRYERREFQERKDLKDSQLEKNKDEIIKKFENYSEGNFKLIFKNYKEKPKIENTIFNYGQEKKIINQIPVDNNNFNILDEVINSASNIKY